MGKAITSESESRLKRVLKQAVALVKEHGFQPSLRDPKEFVRRVGSQLHGLYFLCNFQELKIRVQFHYTFLESFNSIGQEEPSIPWEEFQSYDFAFNGELAEFERPVGRKYNWKDTWDSERKEFREWDPAFITSKAQLALDVLDAASDRWRDPLSLLDQLTPETFEYRVHKPGQDGPNTPVAVWLFSPWNAGEEKLCCLAASIASRYGYGETLVPEYERVYRELLAYDYEAEEDQVDGDEAEKEEAEGDDSSILKHLIRLRRDQTA